MLLRYERGLLLHRIHVKTVPHRGMLLDVVHHYSEVTSLTTGTVKWFNRTKGYGFIQPEDGGADAFVHISAVERAGLDTLNEGERVEYELTRGRNGKSSAENLKIVG